MNLFGRKNRLPPLFVIGAPRCGTTLVGLHAVASFRCAYIPNASKQKPKRAIAAAKEALAGGAWEPAYENSYGTADGPLAPSDGWDVVNRWFKTYAEAGREDARRARGFRDLVADYEDLFDAPLFLKNNHNAMRIGALAELFPDASFVLVKRDLPHAVRSLIEARRRHGVAPGAWWSAAPPQFLGRRFESELEQAAATIWGIEHYVERRFGSLAPSRHLSLDYGSFCADPSRLIEWIDSRYDRLGASLDLRPGAERRPRSFEASTMEPAELAQLEAELEPIVARLEGELQTG